MIENKKLRLNFHGRIIDHLGIQMYQSPVAAIAEMVANSWDADAEQVEVTLPDQLNESAEIVVRDNGIGMTFDECQEHYLTVGWCRREEAEGDHSPEKRRPVLGRKGIGKFAGFGVAEVIQVDTVSKRTGERTVFILDIGVLRSGEYIVQEGGEIAVQAYDPPSEERRSEHGITIRLRKLKLGRRPSPEAFARSMARRFLLHQRVADFVVRVNGQPLPKDEDLAGVEFVFPRDYMNDEAPVGMTRDGEWGVERLRSARQIRWRFIFYREPIEEEEMRGIAVFSRGKLAQNPFFFNLAGGLGGQHGQEYLSGQVEADYVDDLGDDVIATERQRINWEHAETAPLEDWGRTRIKELLRLWHERRGEKRRKEIEDRVAEFSRRLAKLPSHEQRTIKRALTKVGGIPALSEEQFRSLAEAILQAWEQGRLRELINTLANRTDMTTEWLLSTLAEADVLVALNLAEAVCTKLEAVRGLKALVEQRELENALRDYIAERPYLLDPKWETFKREVAVRYIMEEAARAAGLKDGDGEGERKRIDLALRSGEHLLVVEFMRPGKRADWDHLSRCRRYVLLVRDKTSAETALGIQRVTGLIVADRLDDDASVRSEVQELRKSEIYAFSWQSLLEQAERKWREFLEILGSRAPADERLQAVKNRTPAGHDRQDDGGHESGLEERHGDGEGSAA
jgi:RecB family endonuclease NucS